MSDSIEFSMKDVPQFEILAGFLTEVRQLAAERDDAELNALLQSTFAKLAAAEEE